MARLLFVGWDGADCEVVEHMLCSGALPVLAGVRADGSSGAINGLAGLGDDAVWCTFATGVGPGVHGRFHHRQPMESSYLHAHHPRTKVSVPPFWDELAEFGPVFVIDVPKAPLGHAEGVVSLADWMPHGSDFIEPSMHPDGQVLPDEYRPDEGFSCDCLYETDAEIAAHVARIQERGEVRARLVNDWMGKAWTTCIVVVAETHCTGHHAWPADPCAPASVAADSFVGDSYRAADRLLGEMLTAAGPDVGVVVFSPIGMCANHDAAPLLDAILERLEPRRVGRQRRKLLHRIARATPVSVRRVVSRRVPAVRGTTAALLARRNTAYSLPHDAVSGPIRVNVKGREPNGIVEPGAEFDDTCDRISAELLAIRDLDTDRPVVREVIRVAQECPGPHSSAYADLLAVWESPLPVRRIGSPTIGEIEMPPTPRRRGNHRNGGWYVASGPVCADLDGRAIDIVEFATAARRMFGAHDSAVSARSPTDDQRTT